MMISHLPRGRNAASRCSRRLRLAALCSAALLAPGFAPAPCGGASDAARDAEAARGPGETWKAGTAAAIRSSADSAPPAAPGLGAAAAGPCDSTNIELSSPTGSVLGSSRLFLRWRSSDPGPFQVSVLDGKGRTVYAADTYGHELRVLVSGDEAESPVRDEERIRTGRSFRWRVVPEFAPDPAACPTAEFRLLGLDESRAKEAGFEAQSEELGVGDEAREPEASIALAGLYLREGFDSEAEAILLRLRERTYEDGRIEGLLADLYRRTGRRLSLAALEVPPEEPPAF